MSAPILGLVRGLSSALVVAVVALAAMTYRAVSEGTPELALSDAAFNRGELADAVLHARRAATAYAPGAPHTRAALERLRAVAVGSEAVGDAQTARLAWGALRGAALETRHIGVPYEAELHEANSRLEHLAARTPEGDEAERARNARRLRSALSRVPGPSPWAAATLVCGFALALGGLGVVGVLGLTRDGRIVRDKLGLGLAVFLAGAVLWAIAVYRA
jgi:hypothetical protein